MSVQDTTEDTSIMCRPKHYLKICGMNWTHGAANDWELVCPLCMDEVINHFKITQ